MNDAYRQRVFKTLDVLCVSYQEDEEIGDLMLRVRSVMVLAASATELAVMTLSREIVSLIEGKEELHTIDALIERLDGEVSFLPWD